MAGHSDIRALAAAGGIQFENVAAMRNVVTHDYGKNVHNGRLKTCHEVARGLFGANGEHMPSFFGTAASEFAFRHAMTECMHPAAILMSAGHAAFKFYAGAKICGNKANPRPAGMLLVSVASESVGKSRNTDYARKLLSPAFALVQQAKRDAEAAAAAAGAAPPDASQRVDAERAAGGRGGVRRQANRSNSRSHKEPTAYGLALSGKGAAMRCAGAPDSHMYILDEVLSLFTQIGLTGEPARVSETQLEDQSMFSTLWSVGEYMKEP